MHHIRCIRPAYRWAAVGWAGEGVGSKILCSPSAATGSSEPAASARCRITRRPLEATDTHPIPPGSPSSCVFMTIKTEAVAEIPLRFYSFHLRFLSTEPPSRLWSPHQRPSLEMPTGIDGVCVCVCVRDACTWASRPPPPDPLGIDRHVSRWTMPCR